MLFNREQPPDKKLSLKHASLLILAKEDTPSNPLTKTILNLMKIQKGGYYAKTSDIPQISSKELSIPPLR